MTRNANWVFAMNFTQTFGYKKTSDEAFQNANLKLRVNIKILDRVLSILYQLIKFCPMKTNFCNDIKVLLWFTLGDFQIAN